ncbi:metallo-beta-lactamase domain-containing protein [Colletotrichum sp. SAR11_239]|nr:metallo-beta-lactamase domain-containing protein [Colletotrichum sp. SAR11_239]
MASTTDSRADGASTLQHPMPPVFVIRVNTIRARGRPQKKPSAGARQRLGHSQALRLLIRVCKALRAGGHSIPRQARVLIVYDKEADLDNILVFSKFLAIFEDHCLVSSYFGDSRPCMTEHCQLQAVPGAGVKWPTFEAYVNDDDEHKARMRAEWKKHEANRAMSRGHRPPYESFRVIHVLKTDYDECSPNFKRAVVELPLPQVSRQPGTLQSRV